MAKRANPKNTPYALLSAALLGCAVFFVVILCQDGANKGRRTGLSDYAPGFAVQADVVRVMRVVPLAGTSLRSPSVDDKTEYADGLAY